MLGTILSDHTFITYCLAFCIAMAGLLLFALARITRRDASRMVDYTIIMYAGMSYWMAVVAYTRVLTLNGSMDFVHEWWWPLRVYPVAAAMGLIVWHHLRRMCLERTRARQAGILAEKSSTGKMPILVVEDYTALWPVYFGALDGRYDVHFARSCDEVMVKMAEYQYRLVILDLSLGRSGPDGVQVARSLRATYPLTYLVAATGHTVKYPVGEILQVFNDLLYKSFGIRALRATVAIGMKRSARWRELAFNFNTAPV